MLRAMHRRRFLEGSLALGLSPGAWLQRGFVQGTALQYGLHPDERADFRQAFAIYDDLLPPDVRRGAHLTGVVERAITELGALIRDRAEAVLPGPLRHPDAAGAKFVDGPPDLVVFSDHHLTLGAHRHNVFSGTNGAHFQHANRRMYVSVLGQYDTAGYTVVENGDAEDLVVFDTALHPGEFAARNRLIQQDHRDGAPVEQILADLDAHRRTFRAGLLADILADPENREYYAALGRLAAQGRLVRVGGNHDYQVAPFWAEAVEIARRISGLPYFGDDVFCSLLVARASTTNWRSVILHGHQFDYVSSPLNAPRLGETISECLGTFYQGGDRVWPWAESRRWAEGAPFRNLLVSGTPTREQDLENEAREGFSYPATADARRRLWRRTALGPDFWENAFGHPIAWDYFGEGEVGGDSVDDVYSAVALGSTWFKFRHTEELKLCGGLPGALGTTPPHLVLGHTHEPRYGALDASGVPCEWYLNSGAAGRFEGLLWAVELSGGEARVVSWHPDPFPDGPPVRRVWRPSGAWRHELASAVERLS